MRQVQVADETLRACAGYASGRVRRMPVRDPRLERPLETFLGTYGAVCETTGHHDAGVYIAAREAQAQLVARPQRGRYAYPESAGALLRDVPLSAGPLAGYFAACVERAQERLAGAPGMVRVRDATYTLHTAVSVEPLVGLDGERDTLRKRVRQLFLYDPKTMQNPEASRFARTTALCGPPGTGKSSLLKHVIAEGKRLEQLLGRPFAVEVYDASAFSSYFGRSTRVLKRKLERVADPVGVGLLAIEDADMVLQSRDDQYVSHGVLELQQYLLNWLDGVTPWLGNTLTILSSNRPGELDAALRSRVQDVLRIDPFRERVAHEAYFALHVPDLARPARERLAALSHERGLSGRDLAAALARAREATTAEPTDEELLGERSRRRPEPLSAALLEKLLRGA